MLLIILIPIAYEDLKQYKIPNMIIVVGMFVSFFVNVREQGGRGIVFWLVGIMTPIVILWLVFLLGALGAGDVKVFSLVGSFCGYSYVLKVIVVAFVLGAILSIFQLFRYGQVAIRLRFLVNYFTQLCQKKKIEPYYLVDRDGRKCVIHFSVPIILGVYIVWRYCI